MMIVEDGSGITNANSYISLSFADGYFVDRGNSSWAGTDTQKESAIIAATDYIEKRFSTRFRGLKKFLSESGAKSTLTLTQQAQEGSTVTIDGVVIPVVLGDRLSGTILNIIDDINYSDLDFIAYNIPGQSICAQAVFEGEDGNLVNVTTDIVGASWSFNPMNGGNDVGLPQRLSFPRNYLYDTAGKPILGIPTGVKEATAEYAVRALNSTLAPDPEQIISGHTIRRKLEKIGPIEEETVYDTSQSYSLQKYPAADKLLTPYLAFSGGVYR